MCRATGLREIDRREARKARSRSADMTVRFIKRVVQSFACGAVSAENAGDPGSECFGGSAQMQMMMRGAGGYAKAAKTVHCLGKIEPCPFHESVFHNCALRIRRRLQHISCKMDERAAHCIVQRLRCKHIVQQPVGHAGAGCVRLNVGKSGRRHGQALHDDRRLANSVRTLVSRLGT